MEEEDEEVEDGEQEVDVGSDLCMDCCACNLNFSPRASFASTHGKAGVLLEDDDDGEVVEENDLELMAIDGNDLEVEGL